MVRKLGVPFRPELGMGAIGEDGQIAFGLAACEDDVVALLLGVHSRAGTLEKDPEVALDAVQNAEVVAGAEPYYRTMVRAERDSWNVRDVHMADTLDPAGACARAGFEGHRSGPQCSCR